MPGPLHGPGKATDGWRLGFRLKHDRAGEACSTGWHGRSSWQRDSGSNICELRRERTPPAPPPYAQRLVAMVAPQRRSGFNEQPENYRAIFVSQLDQAGFGNEAARFDELARSFATLQNPSPLFITRSLRQQPVSRRCRPPDRRTRRRDCGARRSAVPIETKPRLACTSPPPLRHLCYRRQPAFRRPADRLAAHQHRIVITNSPSW